MVSTPATGTLSINGAAQLVTITRPGQDGWLTFNGVAGQVLTLTTVTPSSRATDIYVYTPSGSQLTTGYANGTNNLKLPSLTSSGVYSVRIDPTSLNTGVYTLSLSAPVAQGGAKVLAKAELPKPAQQGGTAWQQLMAQLQAEGSAPTNRVEVTKYYAFGGARVAMRQAGNEVFYTLGDHLGSASLVMDWQGRKISEMRYTPWGEMRWAWELDGEGYTSRLYTSQLRQSASYVGQLYDYGARFFNPTTGRFISADTIVPNPVNPQNFNRYSYVRNSPVNLNDPTGHCGENPDGSSPCFSGRTVTSRTQLGPTRLKQPARQEPPTVGLPYRGSPNSKKFVVFQFGQSKQTPYAKVNASTGMDAGVIGAGVDVLKKTTDDEVDMQMWGKAAILKMTLSSSKGNVNVTGSMAFSVAGVGVEINDSSAEVSLGPLAAGVDMANATYIAMSEADYFTLSQMNYDPAVLAQQLVTAQSKTVVDPPTLITFGAELGAVIFINNGNVTKRPYAALPDGNQVFLNGGIKLGP